MSRVATLAAVVTLSVGTLTACSGGGDYCKEMQSYAEVARHIDIKDSKAIDKMADAASKLSESAPGDVKDDWKTVLDFTNKLKAAKGDQSKLEKIADSEDMDKAWKVIAANAKDKCKIDIESD